MFNILLPIAKISVLYLLFDLSILSYADSKLLFEVSDDGPRGLNWGVVNDDVMGGRSRGDFEIGAESLIFFGATNTDGGGFASIRSLLINPIPSESKRIKLLVKGDGRIYTVVLRERRSKVSFWATFDSKNSSWQEVSLPLVLFRPNWRGRRLDHRPVDPSAITEIGVMIYDGQDGRFTLELKKIEII